MLYVADVTQAAAAAGLARREPGTFGARITLIPFDGICELGRVQIGGDLGVTPGLVGHLPGIETLLLGAGYQHRTTARPGLWGRTPYVDRLGGQQFREKIDLLPRMACPARPAEPGVACPPCVRITANSRSETLSGSNSLRSTGHL